MSNLADRIAKIQEKIDQEQQRLSDLKARETAQERKNDARRKILYGAAFLALVKDQEDERQAKSFKKIHEFIYNRKDRKFLGLSEPTEKSQSDEDEQNIDSTETPDLPFKNSRAACDRN